MSFLFVHHFHDNSYWSLFYIVQITVYWVFSTYLPVCRLGWVVFHCLLQLFCQILFQYAFQKLPQFVFIFSVFFFPLYIGGVFPLSKPKYTSAIAIQRVLLMIVLMSVCVCACMCIPLLLTAVHPLDILNNSRSLIMQSFKCLFHYVMPYSTYYKGSIIMAIQM